MTKATKMGGWVPPDDRTDEQTALANDFASMAGCFADRGEYIETPPRVILAELEIKTLGKLLPRVHQLTGSCLPGDAGVRIGSGDVVPISEINVGDYVTSHAGFSRRVTDVIRKQTEERICVFKTAYGLLRCTEGHTVAAVLDDVPGEVRWVQAKDVYEGDFLINSRGSSFSESGHRCVLAVVKSRELQDSPAEVWDINVEEDHSFIADGFVVHNCVGAGAARAYSQSMVGDIAHRGDSEDAKLPFPWPTYGVGREIGGMRGKGEGSFGAAQAKAVEKFGMLAWDDERFPKPKVSGNWWRWSQSIELSWSHPRVWPIKRSELEPDANKFTMGTVTRVDSLDEAKQILAQGYGITLASMYGSRNMRVRGDVLLADWNDRWAHQMCFDQDTELLTRYGWKSVADITYEDDLATLNRETHEVEYQAPDALHTYRYSGKMHHYKNRRVDLMVTPNHRLLTAAKSRCKHKRHWQLTESQKIKSGHRMMMIGSGGLAASEGQRPTTYRLSSKVEIPMDVWMSFLGLWMAEGSVYSRTYEQSYAKFGNPVIAVRTGGYVSITHKTDLDEIRLLLNATGLNWSERTDKRGITQWRCYSKVLRDSLSCLGDKSVNKQIPDYVFLLSRPLQQLFFDWMWKGDGCDSRNCYYTTSRQLADGVQMLMMNLGVASRVYKRPMQKPRREGEYYDTCGNTPRSNHPMYVVQVINAHMTFGDGAKLWGRQEVDYAGVVYCASVRNETLLARRNGKCVWTGNSAQGYWEHPDHGLIFAIDNQWGPNAHPKCPTLSKLGVDGSFWMRGDDFAKVIRNGEVFGHSNTNGFPKREFDWGTMGFPI